MKAAFFITGTDTNVGKTLVTSALAHAFANRGYESVAMKPVASGCQLVNGEWLSEDVVMHRQASSLKLPVAEVNPYAFGPAIAPHLAAKEAGVPIDLAKIKSTFTELVRQADVVVVEGAGGFMVPLNDKISTHEIAISLRLPVILVVGMRLGCINHALLTVEAIEHRGLKLAGWVANQIDADMQMLPENLDTLKARIKAPCLGLIPHLPDADFTEAAAALDIQLLL